MTDWDQERELLKEWLFYRIDTPRIWRIPFKRVYEAEEIFRRYIAMGLVYVNNDDAVSRVIEPLTFEQWKESRYQ